MLGELGRSERLVILLVHIADEGGAGDVGLQVVLRVEMGWSILGVAVLHDSVSLNHSIAASTNSPFSAPVTIRYILQRMLLDL